MREHLLKLIDSLDRKYIKSLFKKVFITYDTNDRIPLKKLLLDYRDVYGWITLKNLKELLSQIFVVKKVCGVMVVLGIKYS